MTPTEVLIAAKQKIEQGWCQGRMVRGADGGDRLLYLRDGVAWCADGALSLCGDGKPYQRARSLVMQAADCLSLWDWNDQPGRTKEEVLAAFDQAIALSKATAHGN